MQPIYEFLAKWNKTSDSLTKEQASYATLAVVTFLLAAVVSLVNQNLGQSILFLAIVLGLTFIANGVMWALVRTFAVPHIEKNAPKIPRKK